MYEVEVKVEARHGPLRARLEELDATPLGVAHQRDTYFDHPIRSFAETDEALRVRRESTSGDGATTATITYKGPLVDAASKTREEVETVVVDPESVETILRAVGFEPAVEVEKERERFSIGGYTIALDRVVGLGEFVEIEAAGEASEIESLRDGAFDLCRDLGLDPTESIRTSYLALLVEADADDN